MSLLPTLGLYAALSVISFIVYAIDKSAARQGRWRIPENLLHFLALIGGWPGALAAQQLIRHKSQKRNFQLFFWLTVAINCGIFWWLIIR